MCVSIHILDSSGLSITSYRRHVSLLVSCKGELSTKEELKEARGQIMQKDIIHTHNIVYVYSA